MKVHGGQQYVIINRNPSAVPFCPNHKQHYIAGGFLTAMKCALEKTHLEDRAGHMYTHISESNVRLLSTQHSLTDRSLLSVQEELGQ